MEKILTVREVAEIIKVKPITVREMFRQKRLRAFKVGKSWRTTERMLEEDIEALSEGRSPEHLPSPTESGVPEPEPPEKAPKPKWKAKATAKKPKAAVGQEEDAEEDSQQLLF